jgi:hypothetical protein
MQRDVLVTLPGSPAWLASAMGHRGDEELCDVLKAMNAHNHNFGLICGCVAPGEGDPHEFVVEAIELPLENPDEEPGLPESWAEYYSLRGIPVEAPVALLLSWPLTLLHMLSLKKLTGERKVVVHYLGPEKECMMLPFFKELSVLLPATTLLIEMIGPLSIALPPTLSYPSLLGGSVTIRVTAGLYHDVIDTLARPDLVVGMNAGLSLYEDRWPKTLDLIMERKMPFFFTDYSEQVWRACI